MYYPQTETKANKIKIPKKFPNSNSKTIFGKIFALNTNANFFFFCRYNGWES